jgi:hypothetical protein
MEPAWVRISTIRMRAAEDDLARFVPNSDDHRSLKAIPRHHVTGEVGKAALGLEADFLDPVEILPFIIFEIGVAVVSVEEIAGHGSGARGQSL